MVIYQLQILISYSILCSSVFSFCIFCRFLFTKYNRYHENRTFAIVAFSSFLWSGSFGLMLLSKDYTHAYYYRIGTMAGVLLFLVSVLHLICDLGDVKRKNKVLINSISLLAIPILVLVSRPEETIITSSAWGTTYMFRFSPITHIYSLFSVVVAVIVLGVIVSMIRSDVKRNKSVGKVLFWVEISVVFGMLLDLIFPLLGKVAFPGSTISQFFALLALYIAINRYNRTRINISNISEYVYNSLGMPVLIFDNELYLQIINDAAKSAFDLPERDFSNYQISDLFETKDEDVFLFEEKNHSIECDSHRREGHYNLGISKIVDPYGDTIGYIVMAMDLTERNQYLESLKEAKEIADTANRAKSLFLAAMSHEIRTPMNAIIGFSELALHSSVEDEKIKYINDIRTSSKALLAIINEILDISKIESGKMELINASYYPASIFRDIYFIIDTQAKKKGLNFEINVDSNIPKQLYGDKTRVREILINLLNNAVKYTKEGDICLWIKSFSNTPEEIMLEIHVKDTGMGIRKEDQKKIFDSFSRTEMKVTHNIEGSGLGLAITKNFVELMNGTIELESEFGKGSEFIVKIPQKVIDSSPCKFALELEENDQLKDEFSMGDMKIINTNVLVVDDNRINLRVVGKSFQHYGIMADLASSGAEAIEMCKNKQYDLVFMDQMMPEMDGIEAMHHIRNINSAYATGGKSKIIILTANAIYGSRDMLIEQGFDEYLGKPVNYRKMESIFKQMLPQEKIIL